MRGDYSNGRIYFIEPICEHEDNEFYYGSTIQKLCKRMDKHRSSYKSWKNGKSQKVMCCDLFEKYGIGNCKIYLVELYPCKSKEELESREGYYIRNYNCVNKCTPGRTCEEYYNDNKDIILKHNREYNKENKVNIRTKQCIKIECPCSGKYTRHNKSIHIKTKKHMEYIEEQKPKK